MDFKDTGKNRKTITITVDVDGQKVERYYHGLDAMNVPPEEAWGKRVVDMLDTIEKSTDNKF